MGSLDIFSGIGKIVNQRRGACDMIRRRNVEKKTSPLHFHLLLMWAGNIVVKKFLAYEDD